MTPNGSHQRQTAAERSGADGCPLDVIVMRFCIWFTQVHAIDHF